MYLLTYRNNLSWLASRSAGSIVTARLIALAVSAVFQGFTINEPLSEWAAPANSDKMRTP